MAKLSDYVKKDKIVCTISKDPEEILNSLVEITLKDDKDLVEQAKNHLKNKDVIITLDLGNGFAISHGRIKGLKKIRIGVAVISDSISFEKNKNIRAIFCILVPPEKHRIYLSLLAHISRLFLHKEAQDIFSCNNSQNIISFISKIEAED
ncbi:MAG: PTS sugar transporter subunit IIA [Candidatus Muirbacterium halophilum]|nr:PTS sugar transporter subunit IIA [Candidatus Muirbacterium halophilum]MCK9476119.1 PTS sugar transporter subunit IIA [Candidatus Muirbacterium halophilum]